MYSLCKRAILCLMLLVLLGSKVSASKPNQSELLLRRAETLQQHDHFEEARRLLKELERTSKADKRIYSRLADTYISQFDAGSSDLEQAEAYLKLSASAEDAGEIRDLLGAIRREVARWN